MLGQLSRQLLLRRLVPLNSKSSHYFNYFVNSNKYRPTVQGFIDKIVNVSKPTKAIYCSYDSGSVTAAQFDNYCEETLESLSEYFEELAESISDLKKADISYSDGVLTANLGKNLGTYVINRQTPNRQIWLSSPISGPKRYDFINGEWVYRHDQTSLHKLLDKEISAVLNSPVSFSKNCAFGTGVKK